MYSRAGQSVCVLMITSQRSAKRLPRHVPLLTWSLESFPEAQTLPLAQRAAPAEPTTSRVCSLEAWHFQSPEPDPYSKYCTSPWSCWPNCPMYACSSWWGIYCRRRFALLSARKRRASGKSAGSVRRGTNIARHSAHTIILRRSFIHHLVIM